MLYEMKAKEGVSWPKFLEAWMNWLHISNDYFSSSEF